MRLTLRPSPIGGSPPALVLGSGVTALGVIRSLGRENIPVYYAADRLDFAMRSRWARLVPTGLTEFSGPGDLAAALERIDVARMVLVPCSDSWVRTVAGLDPALALRFPASVASAENLDLLADKLKFAALMIGHGIDHPSTAAIDVRSDLEALPDSAFANAFLKPRDSQAFSARFAVKAFRVASRADAIARFSAIEPTGLKVVLQDYIPGPPTNHYYIDTFVDRKGRTLTSFARQRLRMHSDFANSSCLRSIPLESARAIAARAAVDRIIVALKPVRGMLSAELKLDPRDGRLKVIEVNARAWKHVEFAATCGANICRLAYDDALGRDSAPITRYRDDETCVDLYHDVANFFRLYKKREISFGEWLGSVWGATGPVASTDDPLPAMSYVTGLLADSMQRRLSRVRRGVTS